MPHFLLHDYECRFVFATDAIGEATADDLIGKRPWDLSTDPIQNAAVKKNVLRIFETKTVDRYAMRWTAPAEFGGETRIYLNTTHWLGLPGVAFANIAYDFPAELGDLTARERDVFRHLGFGRGIKAVARELGISPNTTHTHATAIRRKLSLYSIDELTAFAVRYLKATQ